MTTPAVAGHTTAQSQRAFASPTNTAQSPSAGRVHSAVGWPAASSLASGVPRPNPSPGSGPGSPASRAPSPTPGSSATSSRSAAPPSGLGPVMLVTVARAPSRSSPAQPKPLISQPGSPCGDQSGTPARFTTCSSASTPGRAKTVYGATVPWLAHCQALDHRPGARSSPPQRGQVARVAHGQGRGPGAGRQYLSVSSAVRSSRPGSGDVVAVDSAAGGDGLLDDRPDRAADHPANDG